MPKLQLARHVGESINVGNDIKVRVVKVKGHARPVVTIEIEAPAHVRLLRSELEQQGAEPEQQGAKQ